MKLIVGLGNIGEQYHATRHNLGFGVVDMLAISFGKQPSDFTKHSKAPASVLDLKADYDCLLVKPTTMMNLSGEAAGALARFYQVATEDIWAIYDDVDLLFGQIRIRQGGGSAGHNGVKSLIQHLGDDFWRVRLGIANQYLPDTPTDKFVLDPFMQDEAERVPKLLSIAADHVAEALTRGTLIDETLRV